MSWLFNITDCGCGKYYGRFYAVNKISQNVWLPYLAPAVKEESLHLSIKIWMKPLCLWKVLVFGKNEKNILLFHLICLNSQKHCFPYIYWLHVPFSFHSNGSLAWKASKLLSHFIYYIYALYILNVCLQKFYSLYSVLEIYCTKG